MSNIALIFPGQGSQVVGMGKDFYENSNIAKDIFQKVDSILNKPLSKLCFNGPEEDLKRTINTQPAILTVSIIAFEILRSKFNIEFKYTAGHSLGEYSALYASNVLDLETAVNLVKKRSELMDKASFGTMVAIVGLNQPDLENIVKQASSKGVINIANYNTPEQLVITGESEAVDFAANLAQQAGAKRTIPLQVSGAFHSSFMIKPSEEFSKEVSKYTFNAPEVPVVTNIDALPSNEGFDQKLVKQIYSSVRWTQTIEFMKSAGIDTFIEIGPGKVLSGMVKKIDRKLNTLNIEDMGSLDSTLSFLGAKLNV